MTSPGTAPSQKSAFPWMRLLLSAFPWMRLLLSLPDVWQEVSRNLDREGIKKAVETLPAEQREAITLAYFGGLTQQEISERTGAPLGTVKGRMRLGMQKLRTVLVGTAEGETD